MGFFCSRPYGYSGLPDKHDAIDFDRCSSLLLLYIAYGAQAAEHRRMRWIFLIIVLQSTHKLQHIQVTADSCGQYGIYMAIATT